MLDAGGGKHPFVDLETKQRLHLHVIGVDIDANELRQAPHGIYDDVICCDIVRLKSADLADFIICQSVLEHVEDVKEALARMAQLLKPGGRLVLFAPSRHAAFARLNLVLPERVKKWMLFKLFPQAENTQGFPAHYDNCTPREIATLGQSQGLILLEKRAYFLSRYFSFFFPFYLLWRVWTLLFRAIAGDQAAETFSMAFEKPQSDPSQCSTRC